MCNSFVQKKRIICTLALPAYPMDGKAIPWIFMPIFRLCPRTGVFNQRIKHIRAFRTPLLLEYT